MTLILSSDSYRGYSAPISTSQNAQPVFVGRILWPGLDAPEDAVIKLYETDTCGPANEVIGYVANAARGINQPKKCAILLLSKRELSFLNINFEKYADRETGLIVCWITSYEQNAKPFKYFKRLSGFSEKAAQAFYKSQFCKSLASVDHVTGNNDRHDGNFLYLDDLNYLAIDQGCVAGSPRWHSTWPDPAPKNQLHEAARDNLAASDYAAWRADAIMNHERAHPVWAALFPTLDANLQGLLDAEGIEMIVEYMQKRAEGSHFAISCGQLL